MGKGRYRPWMRPLLPCPEPENFLFSGTINLGLCNTRWVGVWERLSRHAVIVLGREWRLFWPDHLQKERRAYSVGDQPQHVYLISPHDSYTVQDLLVLAWWQQSDGRWTRQDERAWKKTLFSPDDPKRLAMGSRWTFCIRRLLEMSEEQILAEITMERLRQ